MIKCPICKAEIKLQNLESHYKIALGDIVNGKFWGKNTLYYHKNCLCKKTNSDEKILSPISE
jgi:hypothetical protein